MSDYSSNSLSESDDFLDRSSSASGFIPSDSSHGDHSDGSRRLGRRAPTSSGTDPISNSWNSVAHPLSTSSSGSGIRRYPSIESFLGGTPNISAPREASDLESWASSSQHDARDEHFALGTPPALAASTPSCQTSRPSSNSSSSSETNESHENELDGQPSHQDANQSWGTTQSDAWSQADEIFLLTENQQFVIPDGGEAMLGLVLPGKELHPTDV